MNKKAGEAAGSTPTDQEMPSEHLPPQSSVQGFLDRSKGGKKRQSEGADERRARDNDLRRRATELRDEGRPKHDIAGILAKDHALSPHYIRRILKNTDPS